MIRFLSSLCFVVLALPGVAGAAPAESPIDATFGSSGRVVTSIQESASAQAIAVQDNDRSIVAGVARDASGRACFVVARYTTDGQIDASFGIGGIVIVPVGEGDAIARAVQVTFDGNILVAGEATRQSGIDFAVIRLRPNGSLDQSFGDGGRALVDVAGDDMAYAMAVQEDNKIVVAGISAGDGLSDVAITRLTDDGHLDLSFGIGGRTRSDVHGSADQAFGVTIDAAGRIIIAGGSGLGEHEAMLVARYTTEGELDADFSSDGIITMSVGDGRDEALAVRQHGDGIVVGGRCAVGDVYEMCLVRLTADGERDPVFGNSGAVMLPAGTTTDALRSIEIDSHDNIVVAGTTSLGRATRDLAVARLRADGSIDAGFSHRGIEVVPIGGSHDFGTGIAIDSRGRVLVSAAVLEGYRYRCSIVRLVGVADTLAPVRPLILGSSHPRGVASSRDVVSITWLPQDDARIAGFSYSFSPSVPAIPDTVADADDTRRSIVSGVLAPGRYYFNIIAIDVDGGVSRVTSYGPIVIVALPTSDGSDVIEGTQLGDAITSRAGNDRIIGNAGRDIINAGAGSDHVNLHDGYPGDRVTCGTGRDRVVADRGDIIAADCERVRRV